ncbi:MAG: porin family protein [Flavobacteriaceae bacterium]|jgi:hypothetical protein|nr:porin family protein [Flavobacteriaceae bacterium]
MKKIFYIYSLLISSLVFPQETESEIKTETEKSFFTFELKGNLVQGIGDSFIADGLKSASGFAFSFSGTFHKNIGLGIEFSSASAKIKDASVFGDLESSKFRFIDIYALYYYPVSKKFALEGDLGGSVVSLKSESEYWDKDFKEDGSAFFLGAKAIYALTKDGTLNLIGGTKIYFFDSNVSIAEPHWNKYYSKSTLLNFNLGVRVRF